MRPRSLVLRVSLGLLRVVSALVPAAARADWRREWEAELLHRSARLAARPRTDWRAEMDLFRRTLGAFPDAAWLRRQFTADAEFVQDVRYGARSLRRAPGFGVAAIVILALGLGATVTIATLLDTLLLRELPYFDVDRVVTIWQRTRAGEEDDVAPGTSSNGGIAFAPSRTLPPCSCTRTRTSAAASWTCCSAPWSAPASSRRSACSPRSAAASRPTTSRRAGTSR